MKSDLRHKKVLILGACGFSGRHLAARLGAMEGLDITGADCVQAGPGAGALSGYTPLDITDRGQVAALIQALKPEWVFNLAGCNRGDPETIDGVNRLGAISLFDAVNAHAPEARVLVVGSAAEYGPVQHSMLPVTESHPCSPAGPYGISKHAMTCAALEYARREGLHIVVARPFNIIGAGMPGGLVISDIMKRALAVFSRDDEPVIRTGNLESRRDFVDVEDVVDAYVAMMEGEFPGEIFNICSGHAVPVSEIVEKMLGYFHRPFTFEVDPALGASKAADISVGSYEKARRAFGFTPTVSLEESIRRIWESMTRG